MMLDVIIKTAKGWFKAIFELQALFTIMCWLHTRLAFLMLKMHSARKVYKGCSRIRFLHTSCIGMISHIVLRDLECR
jgi:hypothetical protein